MPRKRKDTKKRNVIFEEAISFPSYEYQRLVHGSGIVRGIEGKGSNNKKKIAGLEKLKVAS